MAKENKTVEENGKENRVIERTRKFFLAGIGAVMLAQDEFGNLADRLVDKGEVTQEKSRKKIDDFIADRRKQSRKATKKVETGINKRMEKVLNRMNVPSRSEIKALNNKITRLTKKVDEINKASA